MPYSHQAPPQLWRLDRVNDDVRLSLRHTYMPSLDVDFVGTSYFCGKDEQLILCASKSMCSSRENIYDILVSYQSDTVRLVDGHIHIWDRESATLLHDIRVPDGDLTCIAWNTGSDTLMFSTGCHDGNVKIWTSSAQQAGFEGSRPHSAESSTTENSRPESRLSGRMPYSESPQPSTTRLNAGGTATDFSRTSTSTWIEKTQPELRP